MKPYNGKTIEQLNEIYIKAYENRYEWCSNERNWPDKHGDYLIEWSQKECRLFAMQAIAEACAPQASILDNRKFHEAIATRLIHNFEIRRYSDITYADQPLDKLIANVVGNEMNHFPKMPLPEDAAGGGTTYDEYKRGCV